MIEIIDWLKGKKTYFLCIGAIGTAVGMYLGDAITLQELVATIWAALTGMSMRGGIKTAVAPILIAALMFSGCERGGKWHTGSAAADAALTSGTSALVGQVAVAAAKIAQGSDAKEALIQASGDAVRSLEGVAITAVGPVVTERLLKWVPRTPEWQDYAHNVGKSVDTYVAYHGNTPAILQAALEAAALALNTF